MHKLLLQHITENQFPYHPTWVTACIIICIMIVGYVFSAFQSRFILVIESIFRNRMTERLSREEYLLAHPASVLLSLNFLFAVPLFLLLAWEADINILHLDLTLFSFVKTALLVLGIYTVKILVIRFMGFIFDIMAAAREYIFLICIICQGAGVALVPIIVFVAYAPEVLSEFSVYLGVIILGASYILRIGKAILSNLSAGSIPAVYLLLYLCTLEILPALFAYKLFIEAGF